MTRYGPEQWEGRRPSHRSSACSRTPFYVPARTKRPVGLARCCCDAFHPPLTSSSQWSWVVSWNGGGAWRVSLSAPTWSHPRTDSPPSNRTSPVSGRDRKILCKGGGRHRQHPLPAPLSLDHTVYSAIQPSPGIDDGVSGWENARRASRIRNDTWDIHGAHGARQETPARRPNQVLNKSSRSTRRLEPWLR